MSEKVTVEQLFELRRQARCGRITMERFDDLMDQVASGLVSAKQVQAIIENPDPVFGNAVLTIDRSKPFDPARFRIKGWSIWKGPADGDGLSGTEDQDERSLAIATVNLADITFQTTLKESDIGRVRGEERLRRLKASSVIRLDAKVFQAFWENQHLIPESWKDKFIQFDGTIVRLPDGRRYVTCLCWLDFGSISNGWDWYYNLLGCEWDANYVSVVLAK